MVDGVFPTFPVPFLPSSHHIQPFQVLRPAKNFRVQSWSKNPRIAVQNSQSWQKLPRLNLNGYYQTLKQSPWNLGGGKGIKGIWARHVMHPLSIRWAFCQKPWAMTPWDAVEPNQEKLIAGVYGWYGDCMGLLGDHDHGEAEHTWVFN